MKITFDEDYIVEVTDDYSPMRKNVYSKTKVEELTGRKLDDAIREKTKKSNLEFGRRAYLTKKERFVKKQRDYKKLFNKGDVFELKKGVNVLVGDNGCGKSTLIKLFVNQYLKEYPKANIIYIDLEKSNPTVSKPNPEKGITYSAEEVVRMWMWAAESHGETREGVLQAILTYDADLFVLDEPEQGLSLKNQTKYFQKLQELGDSIIITHSKIFVELASEVFDVERMQWIDSKEYLLNI